MYKTNSQQKGFVILFSVLLTSIVLAVALGVSNIALREVALSNTALDSNESFYVADNALECVLAAERNTSTIAFPRQAGQLPVSNIPCYGDSFPVTGGNGVYTATIDIDSTCAIVTVDKTIDKDNDGAGESTVISSRARNTSCDVVNRRSIERILEISFTGDLSV